MPLMCKFGVIFPWNGFLRRALVLDVVTKQVACIMHVLIWGQDWKWNKKSEMEIIKSTRENETHEIVKTQFINNC